jgi:hypothetical protein
VVDLDGLLAQVDAARDWLASDCKGLPTARLTAMRLLVRSGVELDDVLRVRLRPSGGCL